MHHLRILTGTILIALATCSVRAQSEARYIRQIMPRGAQIGTEVELTITGGDGGLADAQELVFYSPGLKTTKLQSNTAGSEVKATVQIAPNCAIGEHAVRVRTLKGLTTLHTFYVGPYPHVQERESETTFESPQPIKLNVTVYGYISKVGKVDFYRIKARRGQRIAAEVRSVRLAQGLFDAHIALLDARGTVLAESDDTGLGHQDPITSVIAPADGPVVIAIRESGYGNEGSYKGPKGKYLLHVGTFPRPLSLVPAGGPPGEEVTMRFYGDAGGTFEQSFKLPKLSATNFGMSGVVPRQSGLLAPTPHPIRVSPLTNVVETEPNDKRDTATRTELALPLALNGVISRNGDVDWFRFRAKKGERYLIQVYGRRIWSRLDSVLRIERADGGDYGSSDDPSRRHGTAMFRYNTHHAGWFAQDALMSVTVPEDGEQLLRVSDQLRKGGPGYHYRIEATRRRPQLTLWVKRDPPYWRGTPGQSVSVPRGNRYAVIVNHRPLHCPDDLSVEAQKLPQGVRLTVPALSERTVPMLFEADDDAPLSAVLTRFRARDPAGNDIDTVFEQAVFYGLNPPNYCFYGVDVDRLAVAVAEEYPVKLQLVPPKTPLVRGGELTLKVIVERKPGLRPGRRPKLTMLYHPPGVSSSISKEIPQGRYEIEFPIEANPQAELGTWSIAIVAREATQLRGGGVSTQLVNLKIAPAYLDVVIERGSVGQGKSARVVCRVEQKIPFEGSAKAELLGLPDGVTADETTVTKDSSQIVFNVQAEKGCPPGLHKTMYCQVTIVKDGAPIVHKLGFGGALRILAADSSGERRALAR